MRGSHRRVRGSSAAPSAGDFRCRYCGILLAERVAGGLRICRCELQAEMVGASFTASIVCYRRRCRQLNVLRIGGKEEASS
jgi:hypothetical protein